MLIHPRDKLPLAIIVTHKMALEMLNSKSLDKCPKSLHTVLKHFFDKRPQEAMELYIQRDDDLKCLNWVWMMGEVSRPLSKDKRPVKLTVFATVAATLETFAANLAAKFPKKKAVMRPKTPDEDFGFGHFVDDDDDDDDDEGTSKPEETTPVKLKPVSINSERKSSKSVGALPRLDPDPPLVLDPLVAIRLKKNKSI